MTDRDYPTNPLEQAKSEFALAFDPEVLMALDEWFVAEYLEEWLGE